MLLSDNKGLNYIAYLIGHQGQGVHVLDLVGIYENRQSLPYAKRYVEMRSAQLEEEGLSATLGDSGSAMDLKTKGTGTAWRDRLRSERKKLLKQLEEAEENNDLGRVDRVRDDIRRIEDYLKAQFATEGDSQMGSAVEKARKSVYSCISSTFDKVDSEHSVFAGHLRNSIKTGVTCSYSPEEFLSWEL